MGTVDLCRQMLHHSLFAERTQERRASEVKDALRFFFTDGEIAEAVAIITGRQIPPSQSNPPQCK